MSSDRSNEYLKQSHDMREKHVNFLLAAAGACIAFAVTQTRDAPLSFTHLPLGLAVLCWALSFWFGCTYVRHRSSNLMVRGINQSLTEDPNSNFSLREIYRVAASNSEGSIASKSNSQAMTGYIWQLRTFVAGAASFLGWHIWEMWAAL